MAQSITKERLTLLTAGDVAASHLMECLAIDLDTLLKSHFPALKGRDLFYLMDGGITKKMKAVGGFLYEEMGFEVFEELSLKKSDLLVGLACYVLRANSNLSIQEKFQKMLPLADHEHFGVREWAWLALRPLIIEHLDLVLELLEPYVISDSERIRRFAIEITRPCGVWCEHIKELRIAPEKALKLLEVVKCDPSRYVQNSLGNWLSDAAKTQRDWVDALCDKWMKESQDKALLYICKRAKRNF